VTSPIEPPKVSEVTQSTESPNSSTATLPSEQSVGRVAEELIQQVNLEPRNGVTERGIRESQPAAFLFAVAAIATLFVIVNYLFVKWRNTIRRTT
jgi:hypothetical protein